MRRRRAAFATLAVVALLPAVFDAQMRYATGQNVGPVFEGWMRNPDGTRSFVFGYLNRNYEQKLDVAVGPENRCEPGPVDCGQPTHFYTRRHRFVFGVPVPQGWDEKAILRWTVTANGRTDSAKAWLHPEMEINYAVMSENNAGGILAEGNQPPTIVVGSSAEAITRAQAVTIAVSVTDDGLPKRRTPAPAVRLDSDPPADRAAAVSASANRRTGVRIRWIKYRGPGAVVFEPDSAPPVEGRAELTTKATFSAPGSYVVRAIASDGQLEAVDDVAVTVN